MKKITFLFFALVYMLSIKAQTVYQTYVVTSNETWDLTNHPNGVDILEKIVIEDGGTLTINDIILRFEPANVWTGSIELKTGGKLFASNVSFTNRTPNSAWHGIRVRGNPAVPWYNLPQQGFLGIESCFFKGANIAILGDNGDGSYISHGTGGGAILVQNSTFQDCHGGVFASEAPLGLTQIKGSIFLITDNYPLYGFHSPNEVPQAIQSFKTSTRINNCIFEVSLPLPIAGNPAVAALGGDVRVWNSNFNGIVSGIFSQSFDPTDNLKVTDNTFYVQNYGLELINQTNSVIIRNEIELWEPARGIYAAGSTNYTIEENHIHADQWYSQPGQNNTRGIEIQYTGLYKNEIYNNTIDKMWYGIPARENLVDDRHGLTIKCNKFTNNKFDIFVWSGPSGEGIYKYQGSMANHPNAPAGNLFSWNVPQSFNFVNSSLEHINYIHHDQSGLPHYPQTYTQQSITLIPNLGNNAQYDDSLTCPSNFPPGGGFVPGDPNDPAMRMAGMIDANSAANEVENLILQLKDGGNTPALVSNVNGSIPPEAYAVYLDLMAESPYLSKEAIEEAIEKDGVISNTMLRDIMVANPHAAKDNELLESIDYRSTPMPDHMKAEIWSGLDVASALENLESIRSFYSQKASRDHRFLVQHYMIDTLDEAASKQALIELLQMGIEPQAYYQLAFMHFNDGQLSQGEQVLNAVSTSFDLNDFQTAELSSMQAYYQIRKHMQQNGQHLGNLNQNQLDAMMDIAEFGQGMAKGYACNILSLYGLCERPDVGELKNQLADEDFLLSKKAIEYERLKNISTAHQHFTVSPNPARDYIAVQLTEDVLAGEATLNIYSAEGKLLKQHLMDTNKREIIIDVSALPPGSYSIAFLRNGKHIDSSGFIIAN
jgi:hypothetical protein